MTNYKIDYLNEGKSIESESIESTIFLNVTIVDANGKRFGVDMPLNVKTINGSTIEELIKDNLKQYEIK